MPPVTITVLKRVLNRAGLGNARLRRKRMEQFIARVHPPSGARILDVGGTEELWHLIDHDFDVTILNLPEGQSESGTPPRERRRYLHVFGDATALDTDQYPDHCYDVVFCNSVIEHVGSDSNQAALAHHVMRLAPAFWVQTPSNRFPLEPHTGVPFYWQLPRIARERLHQRWQRNAPNWFKMVRNTRVLSRARLTELFPGNQLFVERVSMMEKSYAVYRSC